MGRHSAPSAPAGAPKLEWAPVGPTHRPRHAAPTPPAPFRTPTEHGNLALDLRRTELEPAPAPPPPPTLTLVPPPAPRTTGPAHHGAPAPLPMRVLADVVGWAGFAVAVVWVVVVSSGHGVASATVWAASLFGLIAAAVALLVLTNRPVRTTATPAHRPRELDRTRV